MLLLPQPLMKNALEAPKKIQMSRLEPGNPSKQSQKLAMIANTKLLFSI